MNDSYALEFYLNQIVPRGGIVQAIYPKSILAKLLPKVAKERNAKIVVAGRNEFFPQLMKSGLVLNVPAEPDVYIGEPEAFSEHGVFISPHETEEWVHPSVVAIGRQHQWADEHRARFDIVPVKKVVSELGILPYSIFIEKRKFN